MSRPPSHRWHRIDSALGVFLETKLNLEPLPKNKILCVVHFAELLDAIRAVAPILEHAPSAVEIMDWDVLTMARKNLHVAPLCGFLQGDPAAILTIEFSGDSKDEMTRKAKSLAADLEKRQLGYAWPILVERSEQANVWDVGKNGLGLMLGKRGKRKPTHSSRMAACPSPSGPPSGTREAGRCA